MFRILKTTPSTVSGGPWWYNGTIAGGALAASDVWVVRDGPVIPDLLLLHVRAEVTGGDATSDLLLAVNNVDSRNPAVDIGKVHHLPASATGLGVFDATFTNFSYGSIGVMMNEAGATVERHGWLAFAPSSGRLPLLGDAIYLSWSLGGVKYADGGIVRAYIEAVQIV